MNLGNTISSLREREGLKQGELADKLQISQTYLSQIELNKKTPTVSLLERIGAELNTPLPFMFFLSLDEKDIPPSKVEHFKLLQPLLKKFIDDLITEHD